jgi:flagellar basal-body rod protein FlgC
MTLLNAMNISSSGMTTHAQRAQVHATNMANLGTPGYKRQIPILSQQVQVPFADLMGNVKASASGVPANTLNNLGEAGVTMSGTISDPSKGTQLYMPYHPAADANGYVEASTANPLVDMADALMANRMFEANLSVYGILKSMASRSVELGSGR